MAPVTVREIERFLFRPGIAPRARYYAVVFLNQLQLSHDEARGGPCPALVQCAAQPKAPRCWVPEPAAAVPRRCSRRACTPWARILAVPCRPSASGFCRMPEPAATVLTRLKMGLHTLA